MAYTPTIEVMQPRHDGSDYLNKIINLLNDRFTTQESMEMRFQDHCMDIAEELGAKRLTFDDNDNPSFLFDD